MWLTIDTRKSYWAYFTKFHFHIVETDSKCYPFPWRFQISLMMYLQLVLEVLSVVSTLWRWLYSSWAKYSLCCLTSYISFFACNKENILLQPKKINYIQCILQLYDENNFGWRVAAEIRNAVLSHWDTRLTWKFINFFARAYHSTLS